jgi:hypothetical protein
MLKIVAVDAVRPKQILISAMASEITSHDEVMRLMTDTFAELQFGGEWKAKLLMKDFEKFGKVHYVAKFNLVAPTTK